MSPGPWVLSLLLQGPGTSSTDIRARDGWNGRMRGGLPDGGTVNWSGHRGHRPEPGRDTALDSSCACSVVSLVSLVRAWPTITSSAMMPATTNGLQATGRIFCNEIE